jgi:hypothetical protein
MLEAVYRGDPHEPTVGAPRSGAARRERRYMSDVAATCGQASSAGDGVVVRQNAAELFVPVRPTAVIKPPFIAIA